jgi:hypothetical protein
VDVFGDLAKGSRLTAKPQTLSGLFPSSAWADMIGPLGGDPTFSTDAVLPSALLRTRSQQPPECRQSWRDLDGVFGEKVQKKYTKSTDSVPK